MLTFTYDPPKPPTGGGGGGDDGDDDEPVKPTEKPVEKPTEKEEDKIPQTGFNTIPVYAAMIAGAVMVVWGLADIYLGREKK